MTKNDLKRKLTTIFSADVAGYSRLMCRDEETTVITLSEYREMMSQAVKHHRGRVVDSPGDNLLAEFGCAADAVSCAIDVQKKLEIENAALPEGKRMRYRIGINYGEVLEADGRLYGTGVNIAARLESNAEPGGVCISRPVLGRVQGLRPFKYEFMGKYFVKNICKQVDIYRIIMD
jgi:adenylate cyclase